MAGEILVIVNSDLQVTVQNNVVQATVIAPPPTLVNVISPVVPTSIEVISTGPPGPPGPPGVGELNPDHSLLINLDADDHSQYHNDARHALIDHSDLPGVGGGGGHSIQDEGVPLPRRSRLNFVGAGVATTDDVGNDASVVTISGGGGGAVTSVNTQTGDVVLNAADVGADPAGAAVGEVTSHEGNIGVHTITGVTGLQTALDGKSGTSHNHDANYYTETEVDQAFSAHGTSGDHDGQYYEQAVVDTLLSAKENTGVAAAAVTAHEAAGDPHAQYVTDAEHALINHDGLPGVGSGGGDHSDADHADAFDAIGTAAAAVTAHEGAGDPHAQYLTSAEGDAAYEVTGTAANAITAHHAALSTDHDGRYYTEDEIDTSLAGKEDSGVAASLVVSHHDPASTDHDDRYYTEGEIDTALSGKAATAHNHDANYYTETEVDQAFVAHGTSGDHDGQYYEQTVVDSLLSAKENTGVAAGAVTAHEAGTGVHTIAGTTGLQTALDDKLEPIEVLSGVNISVDTTTTPGSVIVNALGFTVGGMIQSEWVWLAAAHAGGQLPSGRAALASDDPSTPADTTLYMHQEDVPNVDWSFYIQDLDVGWVIYAQQKSDSTSWHRWNVRGTPTLNVDTWEIPVQTLAGSPQGTEPGNNDHIIVGFESPHTMSHGALEDLGLDGAHPQYSLTSHDHAGTYDPAGTATGAVTTHEAGTGVHTIAGTTGLQAALDAKEPASWDGTAAQYTALGTYDANTTYYVVG